MCGRFENKIDENFLLQLLQEIKVKLIIDDSVKKRKQENIAPTDKIFAIRLINDELILSMINWGIKFAEDSPLIFNSRIETIKEKKFWRGLFDKNRCVVPMSGFYEWKKEGSRKIPFKIFLPGNKIFYVPALYFVDKEKNVFTSLITTVPNKFIKQIHHRMPVILDFENALKYLSNNEDANLNLCVPYDDSKKMEMIPASI
jgi:putative SOS response-associated peptidase YedK